MPSFQQFWSLKEPGAVHSRKVADVGAAVFDGVDTLASESSVA
jgi:hypothetical protein